jgi:hypothetical protein
LASPAVPDKTRGQIREKTMSVAATPLKSAAKGISANAKPFDW